MYYQHSWEMELGRFICSLGPCINRRTFGKHGCLKCEKDFALNDFDHNMWSFKDAKTEDKIEKNLIGSRTCFSSNPNQNAADAAKQVEEEKWSHTVAKTIGPSNKAAWMITTTSDSSHQKITNPSSSSKGPQSALNQEMRNGETRRPHWKEFWINNTP